MASMTAVGSWLVRASASRVALAGDGGWFPRSVSMVPLHSPYILVPAMETNLPPIMTRTDPIAPVGPAACGHARIAAAAFEEARLFATEQLVNGPAAGIITADDALALLVTQNQHDPRYELLAAFEKQWALLTLGLLANVVTDPTPAVRDARNRGATVTDIATTLGITTQAVYKRYPTTTTRKPHKNNAENA